MQENEETKNIALAMICLEEAICPDIKELENYLDKHFPAIKLSELQKKENSITFTSSSALGFISLIKAPIPKEELKGSLKSVWDWPDAEQKIEKHKAHLIISLLGGELGPLEKNLLLSRLVGTCIAITRKSIAVYWGSSAAIHPSGRFFNQINEASFEKLPIDLWVDFRIHQHLGNKISIFTTGLEAFGLLEIEIQESKGDVKKLFELVYNTAYYLLLNGQVINDGDTIGQSENEKIRVHFGNSLWEAARKVMIIVIV